MCYLRFLDISHMLLQSLPGICRGNGGLIGLVHLQWQAQKLKPMSSMHTVFQNVFKAVNVATMPALLRGHATTQQLLPAVNCPSEPFSKPNSQHGSSLYRRKL